MTGAVSNDILKLLQRVLRHDKKTNNYKIALVRALNDTAINYAAVMGKGHGIAVSLRVLAEWWIGYYWPFMDAQQPVMQGMRITRDEKLRQDMAFREPLTHLKQLWLISDVGSNRAADGMVLASEARRSDFAAVYGFEMVSAYEKTLRAIANAIKYPIQYAGDAAGQYQVFAKEQRQKVMPPGVVALPGTHPEELCLLVSDEMWETLKFFSIYIDALCIQEWSVFTEETTQFGLEVTRGAVYQMLTDRPDNRRPLNWERNRIEILLMEGQDLRCFWTQKPLTIANYDVDHIIPVATYPLNELWNLVPADRQYNQHVKRALMPSNAWVPILPGRLFTTYSFYQQVAELSTALQRDASRRFTAAQTSSLHNLSNAVTTMIFSVADSRSTPRFGLTS